MIGAVRAPHTVAVGNIQERTTQYLACTENEEAYFLVRGPARLLYTANVDKAAGAVAFLATECGCILFPLLEEGQYLAVGPTDNAVALLISKLESKRVTAAPVRHGRRAQLAPGTVPLLVSWEYVTTGASVRPVATGAGGKEGKRYHALYARQEPTGYENELPGAEPEKRQGEEGVPLTGNRHAGITGRSHVPGRKRGYGN